MCVFVCFVFAYRELLIELVGEQGVGQLSEVELTQRANTVDVLDVNIFGQVGDLLRVKLVPDEREKRKRKREEGRGSVNKLSSSEGRRMNGRPPQRDGWRRDVKTSQAAFQEEMIDTSSYNKIIPSKLRLFDQRERNPHIHLY